MKHILLLTFLFAVTFQARCQDVFIGSSKDKISNYYIMSITHFKRTGIMEVFERVKPADGMLQAFRQQNIALRQRGGLSTDGIEKVGYYRRKIQYDCSAKQYRVREITYYDLYGKVINTSDPDLSDDQKWEDIPAATMRELEFNKACR